MNCDEVAALLTGEVDGEVDRLRSHALRKHAAGCPVCGPRLEALQQMRQRLRAELPYHAAPAELRARLLARHAVEPTPPRAAEAGRWRWFGSGVLAGGSLAAMAWLLSAGGLLAGLAEPLPVQLVGLHTRATLGNHLIDVASSDRHTVKPWLSARLDYTIPVADWAAAGFRLMGARIERLEGRPVAVLVYRHRDHLIDVFVRPAAATDPAPAASVVRGFNVAGAQGREMAWLAASDLNAADLSAFVQGLARGQVAPAAE